MRGQDSLRLSRKELRKHVVNTINRAYLSREGASMKFY